MVLSKSVGPSTRLLRWTQYVLLVAAGVIALTMLITGNCLEAAAGSLTFWRVNTSLKKLRSRRKRPGPGMAFTGLTQATAGPVFVPLSCQNEQ